MRYEAVIMSHSLEGIPDVIKLDNNTSAKVKNASVIINEFDKSVDPICTDQPIDKGFTVGLKLEVEIRHFDEKDDGRINVTTRREYLGDYIEFSCDATLKDVVNGINELIHSICNISTLVCEPSEA